MAWVPNFSPKRICWAHDDEIEILEQNSDEYPRRDGDHRTCRQAGIIIDIRRCDSSAWFWKTNGIDEPADRNSLHDVTHIINKALAGIRDRGNMAKRAFALLNGGNDPCSEKWHSALTAANGW